MSHPRFLQIHTLTPYGASLLNRDDVGMAKRLPFGGAERVRISSQCLKRHWRKARCEELPDRQGVECSVRSREIFARRIAPVLVAEGADAVTVTAVLAALQAEVLGSGDKAERTRKPGAEEAAADESFRSLRTDQVLVLGEPEIAFLTAIARELVGQAAGSRDPAGLVKDWFKANRKGARANLAALKRAAGLDAALFGRMVTSDILARGDAAVHVGHSFTVHPAAVEPDYFAAVDDLLQESGEASAGYLNQSELSTGLFYGYVVVDLPLLVSNLEGCPRGDWNLADRRLAGAVIEQLVALIAEVSPRAKLGATAPYAFAEFMLIEAGSRQPCSFANAFLKPVLVRPGEDLRAETLAALSGHLAAFDALYPSGIRRYAALHPVSGLGAERCAGMAALARWAGAVAAGAAP